MKIGGLGASPQASGAGGRIMDRADDMDACKASLIRGSASAEACAPIETMLVHDCRGVVHMFIGAHKAASVPITMLALWWFGIAVAFADTPGQDAIVREQMLKAGLAPGYLPSSALPKGLDLLPPPPAAGSDRERADLEANALVLSAADKARHALAQNDADSRFPAVVQAFDSALDLEIRGNSTPAIYRILQRSFADFALATLPVKRQYRRTRPFVVNSRPSCTPLEEERLRNDGSYPSGHAAFGFGWALVLASISPERSDALLRRGIDLDISCEIC